MNLKFLISNKANIYDTYKLISEKNNYISTFDPEKQNKEKIFIEEKNDNFNENENENYSYNNENENEIYNDKYDFFIESNRLWTNEEDQILLKYIKYSRVRNWKKISNILKTKTPQQCSYRYKKISKEEIKKWTRNEDILIIELAEKYDNNWEVIKSHFPFRNKREIMERYYKKLDSNLNFNFKSEEDDLIFELHKIHGNKWSDISKSFKDKSPSMIKNRYFSLLRKINSSQNSNSENTLSQIKENKYANYSNNIDTESNIKFNMKQLKSKKDFINEETNTKINSLDIDFNYKKKFNNSIENLNKNINKDNKSFIFNQKDFNYKNNLNKITNNKRERDNNKNNKNDKSNNSNLLLNTKDNNNFFLNINNNNNKIYNTNNSNCDEISQFSLNLKKSDVSLWDDNSIIDSLVYDNDFDFEEFVQDFVKIEKNINIGNYIKEENDIDNENYNNINYNFPNLIERENHLSYQNHSDINMDLFEDDMFNFESFNKSQKSEENNTQRFSNRSYYTNSDINLNEISSKIGNYSKDNYLINNESNSQSGNLNKKSLNDLIYVPSVSFNENNLSDNEKIENMEKTPEYNYNKINNEIENNKKDDFQENYNKIFNPNINQTIFSKQKSYGGSYNFNKFKLDDKSISEKKEFNKEEEIKKSNNKIDVNEYDILLFKKYKYLETIYKKYNGFKLNKFTLKKKIKDDKKKGKGKSDEENFIYLTKENELNKEMDNLMFNLKIKKKEYKEEMLINYKSEINLNNMRNLLIMQIDLLINLTINMKMKVDLIKTYEGLNCH